MALIESLRRCHLFEGVSDRELTMVLTFAHEVEADAGAVIFREGQHAHSLYVMQEGSAALEMSVQRPDGGVTLPTTVAVLAPGDALGWSALVEPYVLTATARALVPTMLVDVDGQALREFLQRYRDLGYTVMRNLAYLIAQRLTCSRQALIYERGWVLVS